MTHSKFGQRFTCYQCGLKFFDLNKPKAVCPKCGADQKKAPKKSQSRGKQIVPDDFDDSSDLETIEDGVNDFPIKEEGEEEFRPDHDHMSIEEMPDEEL